jgi:BirA family biotin operon repressor/biotin-[acetyl-CoA-carboxylase] ligase
MTGPQAHPTLREALLEALVSSGASGIDTQVDIVDEIGSTNTALLDRARSTGDVRPRLLMAWRQTQGRGRSGRPWASQPQASLTWSWAQRLQAADWSGLSLAVGVALAQALDPSDAQAGVKPAPRLGLKWPNDLWLLDPRAPMGGRKVGGVLIETLSVDRQRVCVVGVGLNVGPLQGVDPSALSSGMGHLQELIPGVQVAEVLLRAAPAVAKALNEFEQVGFEAFRAEFERRDLLMGRVVVTSGSAPTPLTGLACGVGPDGALMLRGADGHLHAVVAGEVSVRPSPPDVAL